MRRHRFKVWEYTSGYAVEDRKTGLTHWLSDGVDAVFTRTGRAISPGSEHFRRAWEKDLNADGDQTLEAYFPETWNRENAEPLAATRGRT